MFRRYTNCLIPITNVLYIPNRINGHIIIFKEIDTQNLKSIYHNYDIFFPSNSALKNQNFASCTKGHGPGARVYKIFTYFISLQPAGKHCAALSIEIFASFASLLIAGT